MQYFAADTLKCRNKDEAPEIEQSNWQAGIFRRIEFFGNSSEKREKSCGYGNQDKRQSYQHGGIGEAECRETSKELPVD